MTVLYINHGISKHCGVHSFGVRHYDEISKTTQEEIIYFEVDSVEHYLQLCEEHKPWMVFFNYMQIVLPWVSPVINQYQCIRVCVQHLYDNSTIDSLAHSGMGVFHHFVVLDPTVKSHVGNVHTMSRPMVECLGDWAPMKPEGTIHIGSFGFALPHKQIPLIMREINKSFDNACFNLHMTEAHFAPGYTESILNQVMNEITKPDIKVNHSSGFITDREVVTHLSKNHVNALFYDLPPQSVGRSSSLDYMIAAKRPILTTHCDSFAVSNALQVTPLRYPDMSLSDICSYKYEKFQHEAELLYESCSGELLQETEEFIRSLR